MDKFLKKPDPNDSPLRKIVHFCFRNVFGLMTIFILVLSSWIFYYTTTPKVYQIKSLLQFNTSSQSNLFNYEKLMLGDTRAVNLDEKSRLYTSRGNILELIKTLKINYYINNEMFDLGSAKYFDDIEYTPNFDTNEEDSLVFKVELKNDSYDVFDISGNLLQSDINYNNTENLGFGNLLISRKIKPSFTNEIVTLNIFEPARLVSLVTQMILVQTYTTRFIFGGSLLEVNTLNTNPDLAIRILDTLNAIYTRRSIEENSEQADASLQFLQERTDEVKSLLTNSQRQLNEFQEENSLFEPGKDGMELLVKIRELDARIYDLSIEEVEIISRYSEESIILQNFNNKKNILVNERDALVNQISLLPRKQQDFINFTRDVEINSKILEGLINRSLEFSIIRASTLSDVRIVDNAYKGGIVSPTLFGSMIIFIGIGIFICLSYILIRMRLSDKFKLPFEAEQVSYENPLLGVIPNFDSLGISKEKVEDGTGKEAIRSLITNIKMLEQNQVIMVTGPLKGVGKSFISNILSNELNAIGSKIVILDCDFRQGDQHKNFKESKIKLDEFINAHKNIEKYKIKDDLYFLPRPHKSSAYALGVFESQGFAEMISDLKTRFDYVIIDTPPVLPVSDSLSISKLSDISLVVVRHDETRPRELKECLALFNLSGISSTFLVYNGYKKPMGYYGYDYYAYRYYSDSYDYVSKD